MKSKQLLLPGLLAVLLTAPVVYGAPEAGDRSFTLAGNGASDQDFDNNNFGLAGSMGWFLSDTLELGIRQSLSGFDSVGDFDSWSGATRGYVDYHFLFGDNTFIPFVGANLGMVYGDHVKESGAAGVEAGIKFYVKEKTFITLMGEYQFLFEDGDEFEDQVDDGAFYYTLGIGFNF